MSLTVFTREVFRDIRSTAAIVPSSRHLARGMVGPLPLERAQVVVEFGPGTGVMTQELLDRMPGEARLFAFEKNHRFAACLKRKILDPRLTVVVADAQQAGGHLQRLGYDRVDGVVSTLGLTLMPVAVQHRIYEAVLPLVGDGTVVTQVQYRNRNGVRAFLQGYFSSVTATTVWRNVPPAFVYTCRLLAV